MDTKNMDFQSMMASFMQNAQKLQENLKGAYQEISDKHKDRTVVGMAGGDLVKVEVTLKLQVKNIELKPAVFEESPEVMSELIAAATNQAIAQAQEMVKKEMMAVTQKMGLPKDMPMPFSG
ncbi:MAG: YbaB/EbfC family nucleoid-associated protein [Candidatus Berkiella sp.]|jgi:DNA-binding YbaB/EbfC family protein